VTSDRSQITTQNKHHTHSFKSVNLMTDDVITQKL